MPETLVVDSSPILVLARIGRLSLLSQLAHEVVIPSQVVDEILAGPSEDPAREALQQGWGHRMIVSSYDTSIQEWSLGAGESAVLTIALAPFDERHPARAVLDDDAARACARALRIPVIGTLGIILSARKHGLIPLAAPVIHALRNAGLYLDDATISKALRTVTGEVWTP